MKNPIVYINRKTQHYEEEKIYGESALRFFYKNSLFSRCIVYFTAHFSFFSWLVGLWQKLPVSKKKIKPFVEKYHVDTSEFEKPLDQFTSFNDFFCRKLKKETRPLAAEKKVAVIPADGRFLFYPNIQKSDGFVVKQKKFCLEQLLGDASLAQRYEQGSMMIGRLCPTDYHRFHFPCDCIPQKPRLINGPLYSVNPIALAKNLSYLTQNKRVITPLHTENFGVIQYIEIGATNVGSIHQTFQADVPYRKGDEKGFFSFGGSCLILLFEPHSLVFDEDLLRASLTHTEMLCQMGQSMGRSSN